MFQKKPLKKSILPGFVSRQVHLSIHIPLGKLLFCKCSQNLFDIHPFCKGIHSVQKFLESRINKRKRPQENPLKVGFSKQRISKYWLSSRVLNPYALQFRKTKT